MYSITIGKTFLAAFNQKHDSAYSAREFFEKEFFPLFFDHPKYMLWHTNSPFVQMKKGQKPHLLTKEDRMEKLNDLAGKIEAGDRDASVAIGFPASEAKEFATTSGLVSDIQQLIEEEDVYLSWIAAGLGIGISGGYCIFFDEPEILLTLYDGWKIYRQFLNDPTLEKLAPNKINSWNGQWINHYYNKRHRLKTDFFTLNRLQVFKHEKNTVSINTIKWSLLFFNLSKGFPDQILMGYLFSLGQTNKTLGFFSFYLKQAQVLIKYYRLLFGENSAVNDSKTYEELFGVHIKRACELGAIGLHALQPRDLKKYFVQGGTPNFKKKKVPAQKKGESQEAYLCRKEDAAKKDHETVILFRTYKTWLVAMLTKNKEEMLDYTEEVAKALHAYREKGRKNDRKNLIEKQLLLGMTRKKFIDALAEVVMDVQDEYLDLLKELKDRVHLMTSEDFGYFVVLLRFDYAYLERGK